MKLFSLILFLGISVSAFSQGNFDKRLLVKFSQEQLQQLADNQSPVLDYWTYYLDHSYQIVDVPAGKSSESYPEIKFKSAERFNILEKGFSMNSDTKKYFRIKGTNQMLILYSNTEFSKLFNAHRLNKDS